jgi:hypothetical protein
MAGVDPAPVIGGEFRPNGRFPLRRMRTIDPDPTLDLLRSRRSEGWPARAASGAPDVPFEEYLVATIYVLPGDLPIRWLLDPSVNPQLRT